MSCMYDDTLLRCEAVEHNNCEEPTVKDNDGLLCYRAIGEVKAKPMCWDEYIALGLLEGIKCNHSGETEGYLCVYPSGYTSWCPHNEFVKKYVKA